jgi:hypothetical protein
MPSPYGGNDDRIAAEILLDHTIESFRLQGAPGWYSYMFGSEPCNLPKGKLLIAEIHGQHSDGEIADIYRCFCDGMLRKLESFSISGGSLTDDGLKLISMLSSLRVLEVVDCENITDHGARQLTNLCKLESLSLNGNSVGDSLIPAVSTLPLLRELDLGWTNVSDSGLIEFNGNLVIQKLVLDGIALSDNGLARLRCLTNLRTLKVHHTDVTIAGITDLRSYLPDCDIAWGKYPQAK